MGLLELKRNSSLSCSLALFGLLFVCLGACAAPAASDPSQPTFDPMKAFAGRSYGNGTLTVIFQAAQPYHVESRGHVQPDGKFRLDQTVTFAGKPPEKRHWLLKKTSPTTYEGTLSGAKGPVEGHTEGSKFELAYALPGGFTMHQTLTLEPGGKIIGNAGSITFWGIQIGTLHEIIERETSGSAFNSAVCCKGERVNDDWSKRANLRCRPLGRKGCEARSTRRSLVQKAIKENSVGKKRL